MYSHLKQGQNCRVLTAPLVYNVITPEVLLRG